jgi:hypothetical protein
LCLFVDYQKALLQAVKLLAKKHQQLTFTEVLFTSLCKPNDLAAQEFDQKLRFTRYRPIRSQKEADEIFAGANDVLAFTP